MPLRNHTINYQHGWFFVTMQVARNKTMFGVIADENCLLNELGEAVGSGWRGLFERHPEAYQDEFVVMPNHFHAVIRIHMRPTNKCNHLSYLLQSFKSFTTHLYHGLARKGQCPDIGTSLWQSSYYDNLITSHEELNNIRAYIRHNPARWDNDRFGPVTSFYVGNWELLHERLVAYVASEGRGEWRDTEVPCHDIEGGGGYEGGEEGAAPPCNPSQCPSRGAGPLCPACPVISTFTSPQERAVLARCLERQRPYIHVLPGGIPEPLPWKWQAACTAGRALLLSPVAPETGVNKQRAIWCNRYVIDQAQEIWRGHIRRGGTLETLLRGRATHCYTTTISSPQTKPHHYRDPRPPC